MHFPNVVASINAEINCDLTNKMVLCIDFK